MTSREFTEHSHFSESYQIEKHFDAEFLKKFRKWHPLGIPKNHDFGVCFYLWRVFATAATQVGSGALSDRERWDENERNKLSVKAWRGIQAPEFDSGDSLYKLRRI